MGVDLLDFYRGHMSIRRLSVLVRHLPRESLTVQALGGDEVRWGDLEHLVATHIDIAAAVAGSEYRYPRPGEAERADRERKARAARYEAHRAERQRQLAELEAGKEAST